MSQEFFIPRITVWRLFLSDISFVKKIYLFCLSVIFIIIFPINSANADKISFSICYEDIDNIPLYYGEGSDVPKIHPGLYIDILKLVGKRLNLRVTFYRAPWARCLKELELNQADGVLAASYTVSRAKFSHFPTIAGKVDIGRRIYSQSYYLYRRSGSSASWDGSKFLNINKIGAQIGYSIIGLLEEHDLDVNETSSVQRGFSQLQAGRIEGFATLDEIGLGLLTRYPDKYNQIEKVEPALAVKPYYLIVGKSYYSKHSEIAEAIWNEISVIREKELSKIIASYGDVPSP